MSFGYLPQSDVETGALRTNEEMQKSVRKFQKFAQLPETGELDSKTLEMMTVGPFYYSIELDVFPFTRISVFS